MVAEYRVKITYAAQTFGPPLTTDEIADALELVPDREDACMESVEVTVTTGRDDG